MLVYEKEEYEGNFSFKKESEALKEIMEDNKKFF